MAIRVYDLSKKYGVSNKELLDLLKEHGIVLTSIAVATPEAIDLAEKLLGKKGATQKTDTEELKAPQEQPIKPVAQPAPVAKPVQPVAQPQPSPIAKPEEKPVVKPVQTQPRPAATPSRPFTRPQPAQRIPQKAKEPVVDIKKGQEPLRIEPMTVGDFADRAQKQVSEVIMTLLKQGVVANKNQLINEKVVAQLVRHYELVPEEKTKEKPKEAMLKEMKSEGTWVERLPVVVVIGHVDHGKTTLLDHIRKTRVASREKGGITQHLGAYEVKLSQGGCVFLDTPGHEAFSLMRARGIKVADIAILVIAADDGIMPQTIEAIETAKAANLPIIVALNKIDKASAAQIETVKRQLAQHNLVPEDWGGQTVVQPISAKMGTGIDALLEVIILQSQLMDLKANITVPATGYVLESHMEKGRGPVATVICQHGLLKVGDYFIAGLTSGKASSLVDSYGKRVTEIKPSMPVQIAGFSELPHVGDVFEVVTQQEAKKGVGTARLETAYKKSLGEAEMPLLVKTDNASSREALVNALSRIKASHRTITIVYAGVGDITESDITLASDTQATIYGFHVKSQPGVGVFAKKKGILIKNFDIIYKLLEDVELLLEAGKPKKMISKKIGEAIVLKVFDIKDLGIIAGAQVKTGRFIRDGKVFIWRGKHKVGEGGIKGLQRERKSVKEVHAGFECAFLVDGFDTWEVDDRVECFQEMPAT